MNTAADRIGIAAGASVRSPELSLDGRCVGSVQAVHEYPNHRSELHRCCPCHAAASHGKRLPPRERTLLHRTAWASNSRTVERLLRETGHADGRSAASDDNGSNRAPYSKVLSLPSFFAPEKKEGRPRGRNPRLRAAERPQRLNTHRWLHRSPAQQAAAQSRKPTSRPQCIRHSPRQQGSA